MPPHRKENKEDLDEAARRMLKQVSDRRRRMEQHRRVGDRPFLSNLALIGAVGWGVVVPALAGGFGGFYLDRRFGTGITWTLSLLLVGLGLGCFNAWRIIRQERD